MLQGRFGGGPIINLTADHQGQIRHRAGQLAEGLIRIEPFGLEIIGGQRNGVDGFGRQALDQRLPRFPGLEKGNIRVNDPPVGNPKRQ